MEMMEGADLQTQSADIQYIIFLSSLSLQFWHTLQNTLDFFRTYQPTTASTYHTLVNQMFAELVYRILAES